MGHLYHGYVSHNQRVYTVNDDFNPMFWWWGGAITSFGACTHVMLRLLSTCTMGLTVRHECIQMFSVTVRHEVWGSTSHDKLYMGSYVTNVFC